MLLTVDIGNTNTVTGVYDEEENLLFTSRIETNPSRMADEYTFMFINSLALHGLEKSDITGSIISSVVPPSTDQIKNSISRYFGIESMIVGPGLKTGLNIRIDDPATLGADMCCVGVAAKEHYKLPCIIVDLGTASKVLYVNEKGEFLGGAISVGVKMALNALSANTAALPLISTGRVDKAIGANTVDCMRSGVIIGIAGMIDGLIDRFEKEEGKAGSIVATGGYSPIVMPHCVKETVQDPDLLLKGLLAIYKRNKV